MGKYTTEVRYICETYAGLTESEGYDSIEEIIENSYLHIFDNANIPMYNGEETSHRSGLLKKILLHYYTREIGYETVGLWKLKLNQKLKEIMPYYNKLYESELIDFDPLENVNVTNAYEGEFVKDETANSEQNVTQDVDTHTEQTSDSSEDITLRHSKTTTQGDDTRTNDVLVNGNNWVLFSDTPQGGLDGIEGASSDSLANNGYLTNATRTITTPDEQSITQTHGNIVETFNAEQDKVDTTSVHAEVETQTNQGTTGNTTNESTKNNTGNDSYTKNDIGKIGTETYSEMLQKYRDTFLNIDMMVIRELEPLFIGLW